MRPYAGRRTFAISDPVVEPFWSGCRVLAHVTAPSAPGHDPQVRLQDDEGSDLGAELPELAAAIGRSVLARDAVVDGVISVQVGLDGIGAAAIPEMHDRPGLIRSRVDLDVPAPRRDEELADADEGFVAVDLLRVDGTVLLGLPLLERKRLLESVVRADKVVIVSVHVRPPAETWVATWKSVGLRGAMLKAANSRYVPGEDSVEWRIVERLSGR
jgi:ATP-dependent DNA ligase